MMLSICIPVYNFDVNPLITELKNQIEKHQLDAEIILIDDASASDFIVKNQSLVNLVDQFVFLENNIGRSKIRNLFLDYTNADYLLFLDCDGKITDKAFLKYYCDYITKKHPDVIFGGRKVSKEKPDLEFGLRWRFATERENLPVKERLRYPYSSFQTNNFVVKKEVLEEVKFDETIKDYGYEDLVFAMDLQKHKFKIHHLSNPILNDDVETNEIFLSKADQSAQTLSELLKNRKDDESDFPIKLVKVYRFLKQNHLLFFYNLFYQVCKKPIKKKLLRGNSSLKLLDAYKLGQLIGYMKK